MVSDEGLEWVMPWSSQNLLLPEVGLVLACVQPPGSRELAKLDMGDEEASPTAAKDDSRAGERLSWLC